MARRKGWRAVKKHQSYTVHEAARNQGVAKGTVLRWLKSGLLCLKDQRPWLILGPDLITFLKGLNPAKQKMRADEFYCFKCRAPRKPAFREADFTPRNAATGRLTALCCECTTVMHKSVSKATLVALKPVLRLSFPQGHERIGDTTKPRTNDH
jgi:lysophospholipase L1-like esterase